MGHTSQTSQVISGLITLCYNIVLCYLNISLLKSRHQPPAAAVMLRLLLATVAIASASAIVCTPDMCNGVTQEVLNCKGNVIKNGGFCGCTDVCARVENEPCKDHLVLLGVPNDAVCDQGLVCAPLMLEGYSQGHRCQSQDRLQGKVDGDELLMSKKRQASGCETACQKKSERCTFSFVIYASQWFADCDANGAFKAKQCQRDQQKCWCVNSAGETLVGSTVQGQTTTMC